MRPRRLVRPVDLRGIGLHTGVRVALRVVPCDEPGLSFVRRDLAGQPVLPASLSCAVREPRRVPLERGGVRVESVEHVLAALHAAGLWRARILVDGPETPALDGSAGPYYRALVAASVPDEAAPAPLRALRIVRLREGDRCAALLPAADTRLSARVDVRGRPWRLRGLGPDDFASLVDARTFAYVEEVEALRRAGLARGGTLDNALVLGPDGPLNAGGARASDEPARHKLLDALGDLALLGAPLRGHVVAVRPSHRLTIGLLRQACTEGAIAGFAPDPAGATPREPEPRSPETLS